MPLFYTTKNPSYAPLPIAGTKPQRFTLRSALDEFLDFRFTTVRNKVDYDLSKALGRNHIVEGLLKALTSVDHVIEIVRNAPDQTAARKELMDENDERLDFSREQADAVLKVKWRGGGSSLIVILHRHPYRNFLPTLLISPSAPTRATHPPER